MTHITIVILALLAVCVPAGKIEAAEISVRYDETTNCIIHLNGLIEPGDAQRLEVALENLDSQWAVYRSICLDSPGGSILEGIKLLNSIWENQVSTIVPARATCESACAIAFLGGSRWAGNYIEQSRWLMPGASLGFHSPGLVVRQDSTYLGSDIERAFEVALEASDALVGLLGPNNGVMQQSPMNLYLLRVILGTPSSSMYRVKDLLGAALADIDIHGAGLPEAVDSENVENLCDAAFVRTFPNFTQMTSAQTATLSDVASRAEFYTGIAILEEIRDSSPRGSVLKPRGSLVMADGATVKGMVMGYNLPGSSAIACLMNWGRGNPGVGVQFFEYNMFIESTILSNALIERLSDDSAGPVREFDFLKRGIISAAFFYDPLTLLSAIPLDSGMVHRDNTSCRLNSSFIRLANVNEAANLRSQPDFSAPVIRQMPLGEHVRASLPNNFTVIGQERDRQSCISACEAFEVNGEDRTARERVQQCINDNMLWYYITDARGNRGWVSRKFLEEVE